MTEAIVRRTVRVLLGMNGIVPGRMTPRRWAAILGSFAAYATLLAPRPLPSLAGAYFATATLLHYAYLFGMFGDGGWARRLRERRGDEQGYLVHEGWMALAFCHNALSTGFICVATSGALRATPVTGVLAAALIVAGLVVKVWATLIVGLDAYYYRDLFLERAGGSFERRGPYRWLRNPMYTVGHLQAYGLALWYGSVWGLAAVAINQALVLWFNAVVEQPHLRRVHADKGDRGDGSPPSPSSPSPLR